MKSKRFLMLIMLVPSYMLAAATASHEPTVPPYLYKIVTPELWEQSKGKKFLARTENDTAFIHLSMEHQIKPVLEKRFKDRAYTILKIETSSLVQKQLRLEPNSSKTESFWHLYDGEIPLTAITEVKNSGSK